MTVDPRETRSATQWDASGHLVRLRVGLEDPADLMADLERGFGRFRSAM